MNVNNYEKFLLVAEVFLEYIIKSKLNGVEADQNECYAHRQAFFILFLKKIDSVYFFLFFMHRKTHPKLVNEIVIETSVHSL